METAVFKCLKVKLSKPENWMLKIGTLIPKKTLSRGDGGQGTEGANISLKSQVLLYKFMYTSHSHLL